MPFKHWQALHNLVPLFKITKITNYSSKYELMFDYSTNAAKPHSCGNNDLI